MTEMQKNIQAALAIAGAVLFVAGFAMFKLALGLIVAGIVCLAPTFMRKK